MVKTGLEVLLEERPSRLKGARVALIAHPASIDSRLHHSIDLFYARKDFRLMLILGPEHGARGEAQDQIELGDSADEDFRFAAFTENR